MRPSKLLVFASILVPSTYAIEPIPQQSGYSGFVNIGAGGARIESTTLAKFGFIDLGKDTIDSLDKGPDSETSGMPVIALELSYTFADSRTQVFLGNQLEDFIRFDSSTFAGVRQEVGNAGIIGASLLYTSLATEVWQDPFLTGSPRTETDRTANGYRLIWDKVYGTNLELRYSYRDVDIDNERSGESLGLSDAELALLNRSGDRHRVSAQYTFSWDAPKHRLIPAIAYIDHDSRGAAMSYNGFSLSANYIYSVNRWRFVTNAYISDLEFDEANPVFDRKADGNQYGASLTAFYSKPFGWNDWHANAGIAWFEADSDINFYDSSVMLISVGMLYRF